MTAVKTGLLSRGLLVACAASIALALTGCNGSSPAGSQTQASEAKEASCYVMTRSELYQNGELAVSWEWTHDERGGVVEQIMAFHASDEEMPSQAAVTKNELDEHGWETRSTTESMGVTTVTTYEYKGEAHNGLYDAFTSTSNASGSTSVDDCVLVWYENSILKSQALTSMAISTEKTFREDGYLSSSTTKPMGGSGAVPTTREYSYEEDSSGNIASITSKGSQGSASETITYTCECDENGNIVKLVNPDGTTAATYSWEKVANPYPRTYAMARANISANL